MNNFQAQPCFASSLLSCARCASSKATRNAPRNAPFKKSGTVCITLALCLKISGDRNSSKLAIPIATFRTLTSSSTCSPVGGMSSTSASPSSTSELPLSGSVSFSSPSADPVSDINSERRSRTSSRSQRFKPVLTGHSIGRTFASYWRTGFWLLRVDQHQPSNCPRTCRHRRHRG